MINFLEAFMPWALGLQYAFLVVVYLSAGKIGPAMYWIGATILNVGVIIMSRTSN
jgi:hypothetical protein